MEQKTVKGINAAIDFIKGHQFLLVCDSTYDFLPIKTTFDVIPHTTFSDFTPNPLYEQVVEGVRLFNENKCDMIVAIGGGSTIDVAKCIKLYCRMDPTVNYLEQEMQDTGIPLIAIPTTAGTGSEATRHAVIYYEGKKQSISHPSIVPDIAVLEPSLLKTLPVYQKKCTMLDALCQACESWWNFHRTEESIRYSKEAISLITENADLYLLDNDKTAAEKIMIAANLAGRAINITATTAAHAMSYKITSLYGKPHGHAVAICFSEVWREMWNELACGQVINEELKGIFEQIAVQMGHGSVPEAITHFDEMLKRYGVLAPETDDYEKDIDLLTNSVNPVRLKNNPIQFDSMTIRRMYQNIIKKHY